MSNKGWIIGGSIAATVLIGALILITPYNGMVGGQNEIKQAQSQLENVLQRRYELLINQGAVVNSYKTTQVELVKQFTGAIAQANSVQAQGSGDLAQVQALDKATNQGVLALLSLSKAEVKADPTVWNNLMVQVEGSQNRVTVERKRLIDAINGQNNRIQKFPGNLFAGVYGFSTVPEYQAPPNTQQNPDLKTVLSE